MHLDIYEIQSKRFHFTLNPSPGLSHIVIYRRQEERDGEVGEGVREWGGRVQRTHTLASQTYNAFPQEGQRTFPGLWTLHIPQI